MMKAAVFASLLLLAAPLASANGLRSEPVRKLQAENLEEDQELVEGGTFMLDASDREDNPGSIIWTGQGNSANDASSLGLDTCFSGETSVQVLGVGTTAMKDLRVGDRVLTGNNQFEPVYAFAHQNHVREEEFVALHTTTNREPLELTHTHMVFLQGKDEPVRADDIKAGDFLRGDDASREVTRISSVKRHGIYAPLTSSGTVVVNGVVSSSYAAWHQGTKVRVNASFLGEDFATFLSQHDYCHLGLSPYRLYCGIVECSSYNKDGMPGYVAFAYWLANWVQELPAILQILYLVGFLVVFGTSFLLEIALTPVGFITVAILCVAWRNNTELEQQHQQQGKKESSMASPER